MVAPNPIVDRCPSQVELERVLEQYMLYNSNKTRGKACFQIKGILEQRLLEAHKTLTNNDVRVAVETAFADEAPRHPPSGEGGSSGGGGGGGGGAAAAAGPSTAVVATASVEADEEFAARLQAQEYGGASPQPSSSGSGDGPSEGGESEPLGKKRRAAHGDGGGGGGGASDGAAGTAAERQGSGSFERVGLRAGSADDEDEHVTADCTAPLKHGFLVQTALYIRERIDSLASFCVICDQKHSWGGQ